MNAKNFFQSNRKQDCCGCGACVAVCPAKCISIQRDEEGFDYPRVEESLCTQCGKCEKVCPVVCPPSRSAHKQRPPAYACWHLDDQIRAESSSGGVFTGLAQYALRAGSVVYGAAFDANFKGVSHIPARTEAELAPLRGSKYVQSASVEAFREIRKLLNGGRRVCFVGTPCQVAGLRKLVGKKNEKLLTADLICHGVPSPDVFLKYIEEDERGVGSHTIAYCFRDKTSSWNCPVVSRIYGDNERSAVINWGDRFMHGFLLNVFLRPICYECPFVGLPRFGDLTLADYWGVSTRFPQYDDDRGTSLVLVNTSKGGFYMRNTGDLLFSAPGDLDHAMAHNPHMVTPAKEPANRKEFFEAFRLGTFRSASKVYFRKRLVWKRYATRLAKRLVLAIRRRRAARLAVMLREHRA